MIDLLHAGCLLPLKNWGVQENEFSPVITYFWDRAEFLHVLIFK
jgi:hypothetical protein